MDIRSQLEVILGEDNILLNATRAIEHYQRLADSNQAKADELLDRGIRWKLRGQEAVDAATEIAVFFGRASAYQVVVRDFNKWIEDQKRQLEESRKGAELPNPDQHGRAVWPK